MMMMKVFHSSRITSSKVLVSLFLTSVIILCQLLLFHHYFRFISNSSDDSWQNSNNYPLELVFCQFNRLRHIHELALNSDVDLVLIDPDVVKSNDSLKRESSQLEFSSSNYHQQRQQLKRSQESSHKSILHLAIINETSGGQPNLKLFYESLKNNGYITLQYDSSQPMQAEVYRRASHLFDEAHEIHDRAKNVSKIYTEFIAHIFILNSTASFPAETLNHQVKYSCERRGLYSGGLAGMRNTVIHILVLYNYKFNPKSEWIQPALQLDELDKHKLLAYNVHWVDFRIPIEHHYLHRKRSTSIIQASIVANQQNPTAGGRLEASQRLTVFEPAEDRTLSYVNNSFVYCKSLPFNISALIDGQKKYSRYLMMLDGSRPLLASEFKSELESQLDLALQFMATYSQVYGSFSFWLTGSTLLAYLKFCDLTSSFADLDELDSSSSSSLSSSSSAIDQELKLTIELGVLSSEFNETVLNGLADATNIGVKMLSDWRKPNPVIRFRLADCPNVTFQIYSYELRKDFYQHYYATRTSMVWNHKRNRRRMIVGESTRPDESQSSSSSPSSSSSSWSYHVFALHNLELCWTQIGAISKPLRVPCNIYDHLRRIYII